jgi:hypothetical protein
MFSNLKKSFFVLKSRQQCYYISKSSSLKISKSFYQSASTGHLLFSPISQILSSSFLKQNFQLDNLLLFTTSIPVARETLL